MVHQYQEQNALYTCDCNQYMRQIVEWDRNDEFRHVVQASTRSQHNGKNTGVLNEESVTLREWSNWLWRGYAVNDIDNGVVQKSTQW